MTETFVRAERHDDVLIVTLTRPERLNALHSPAHFALSAIFDDFEADDRLRVAIITGEGKAFCAGNDLKWQAAGGAMERPATGFAGLTMRFGRSKPVIAAVNGIAIGGGFEIVLSCDLAVATASSRFSFPEIRRGLVPLAGVHVLPRQVSRKTATALLLALKALSAEDALKLGMINEIVDDGTALDAALRWAEGIIKGSPTAIATCLDMWERSAASPDLQEAMTADYDSLRRLRESPDFKEGPLAFAEKRRPRWQ